MTAALLLLADSRLPAGGHAHSGGIEAAVADGSVRGTTELAAFLAGRLATAGHTAAALAAAVAALPAGPAYDAAVLELDAEANARSASPALRAASRAQGRALLRAGRAAFPAAPPVAPPVASSTAPPAASSTARPVASCGAPPGVSPRASRVTPAAVFSAVRCPLAAPHHPVALGAVAQAGGLGPADAALAAAYGAVTGPASAAVRLLGLDPLAVTGLLAALAGEIDRVAAAAAEAGRAVAAGRRPARDLPAPAAPRLELLAERHRAAAVRLFAS